MHKEHDLDELDVLKSLFSVADDEILELVLWTDTTGVLSSFSFRVASNSVGIS